MEDINSIDKTRQDKTRQDKHSQQPQNCQVVVLGQMDNTIDHTFESANRVYDKNQLCPTIPTCGGGNIQPKVIESKYIVAMRGRNPERPTDRTAGLPTVQRLEKAPEGMVNTLTTVQKDNLVLEENKIERVGQISNDGSQYGTVISENGLSSTLTAGTHGYANNCVLISQATKEGSIKCKVGGCYDASFPGSTTRRGRVQNGGDVTPTITAQGGENINFVETVYRIRKLTPKECWRLMGYTDGDFEKASTVNSNTQLYKQAGNAIVKQVLMAIFSQML